MTKKEKVKYIIDELEKLYPETPIPLDHTDEYTLLIAVLLSAQCTDVRVNKVTPALFKMAKTPSEMIKHTVEEIKQIIQYLNLKTHQIGKRKSMLMQKINQLNEYRTALISALVTGKVDVRSL